MRLFTCHAVIPAEYSAPERRKHCVSTNGINIRFQRSLFCIIRFILRFIQGLQQYARCLSQIIDSNRG
jgi:hypothetical protein